MGTTTTELTLDDGCARPTPSTWLWYGDYHTIPMIQAPVTGQIEAEPSTVCPGGSVRLTITLWNHGRKNYTLESPTILLHGGSDKWRLAQLDSVTVPANDKLEVETTASIPLVQPRDTPYGIVVYQHRAGGELWITEPG